MLASAILSLACMALVVALCDENILQRIPMSDFCQSDSTANTSSLRVAIVGGGIAGASAAFHLAKTFQASSSRLEVIVFEAESQVGGRTRAVCPPHNDRTQVESGATHFFQDD